MEIPATKESQPIEKAGYPDALVDTLKSEDIYILNEKIPFATRLITKLAPKVGAKVVLEPEFGYVGQILYSNGKKMLFRRNNFNLNALGSVEIAKDKGYAKFFLQQNGYSTPKGQTFFSEKRNEHLKLKRTIDDGYDYIVEQL
jgi:hypothetical protein